MCINIEGKEVRFTVFGDESEEQAMNRVYASMGIFKRPSSENSSAMLTVNAKDGFTKEVTMLDVLDNLTKRFRITTNAFTHGESAKLYRNMDKVILNPTEAAKFTKDAVLMSRDEFNKAVASLEFEKLDIFDGYIKIRSDKTMEFLSKDKKMFGYADYKNDTFYATRPLTDKEEKDLAGFKIVYINTVTIATPIQKIKESVATVMPDVKVKETKATEKPVIIDATLVEEKHTPEYIQAHFVDSTNARIATVMVKATEKPVIIDAVLVEEKHKPGTSQDQFVKSTKAREAILKEKTKQKVEVVDTPKETVTTITNPEQTITLANTTPIAIKIDIDLIKEFVNLDSIKNIPQEEHDRVLLRLEGAIKGVQKAPDWKTYLSKRNKYGFSKSGFFGRDAFIMFNGVYYLTFDAIEFSFDKTTKK